jgi:hypothetical protein
LCARLLGAGDRIRPTQVGREGKEGKREIPHRGKPYPKPARTGALPGYGPEEKDKIHQWTLLKGTILIKWKSKDGPGFDFAQGIKTDIHHNKGLTRTNR